MSAPTQEVAAAALATLAQAASHWREADRLADTCDQTEESLRDLVSVAERIVREATAIPAETGDALRSKARVLARIEGPAFRDEASLTYAGQALLLSLLNDLTGEGGSA